MAHPDRLRLRLARGAGGFGVALVALWVVVALGRTSRIWGDLDGCVLAKPGWTWLQLAVAVVGAGLVLRVLAGRPLRRSSAALMLTTAVILAAAWLVVVVALPAASQLDGCSS